jgi:hypothetical protein
VLCYKCLKEIKEENRYGLHQECFMVWFKLKADAEFRDLELRSDSDPDKKGKKNKSWNTSFFHGNYKKYSTSLAGESYILKVKEAAYPELPEVEYTCNRIARSLKLPVSEFYLLSLVGERVFVTKNFCKTSTTRMTLDHIYKYLKEGSEFNCETIIEVIFKETGRYSDVSTFIDTCLFDALIGNHDRHGGNIGLIVTAKGTRLSPIYDNPSHLGLESGKFLDMHWSPKGKIFTSEEVEPTAKDYVKEFIRLEQEEIVFEFIDRINESEIMKIIDEGFCTPLMKKALKNLVNERINEYHESDPR